MDVTHLAYLLVIPVQGIQKAFNFILKKRECIDPLDGELKVLQNMLDLSARQGYDSYVSLSELTDKGNNYEILSS